MESYVLCGFFFKFSSVKNINLALQNNSMENLSSINTFILLFKEHIAHYNASCKTYNEFYESNHIDDAYELELVKKSIHDLINTYRFVDEYEESFLLQIREHYPVVFRKFHTGTIEVFPDIATLIMRYGKDRSIQKDMCFLSTCAISVLAKLGNNETSSENILNDERIEI